MILILLIILDEAVCPVFLLGASALINCYVLVKPQGEIAEIKTVTLKSTEADMSGRLEDSADWSAFIGPS